MRIQNIQNIQLTQNIYFQNRRKTQQTQPIHHTQSPVKEGLKTAGVWLGFGVALDFVCRKCVVFKNSPTKNSLFVNSVLAIIAGAYTTIKAYNSHDFTGR